VVCDPESNDLIVQLARRGYRLLVLHDGSFEIAELRQELRSLGLSSQLMGSHCYSQGATVGLVADFYELCVFCQTPSLLPEVLGSLKKGAAIYWQATHFLEPEAFPRGLERLRGLPAPLQGGRTL
jgi:hypothetical protein